MLHVPAPLAPGMRPWKEPPMSLDPVLYYAMPEDTARVARAAFPNGNV